MGGGTVASVPRHHTASRPVSASGGQNLSGKTRVSCVFVAEVSGGFSPQQSIIAVTRGKCT